MNINKKHIILIDLILVVGSLIVVAGLVGYTQPLVIGPIDDLETSNTSILFSFENANVILIDDNPDFSSPEEIFVEDNLVINFKPGVYYWRIKGISESTVRKLTIVSEVNLKVRKAEGDQENKYDLVNAGNVPLEVDIFENGSLRTDVILGVDESTEASGTKFIGRQDE